MNSNESLKVINTTCQESQCRFASKRLNDDLVALTIRQVEPGDSGRYYCGEYLSSYLQFNGNGSVLKVGDVWMNHSAVHMLMEWMGEGGSPELALNETRTSNSRDELVSEWMNKADANSNSDQSEVPEHTELRCVVTGLSAPWVNIFWRSSQESWEKAGQTWSFTDTGRGYRVESRLRIGLKVKSDWEYEYEYENLDRMVDMDEELWCEVQVGVNSTVQSPKFSFLQQTHTDPEWCDKLLYGEIALCALCVCLLTLLLCHCLQHKHKGMLHTLL
ncbi:uncharacterized protein LOC133108041 [Conger conger]|uniref:uncharacterized protein LOC133108041 n=1 Tax=Conger conger TaxID=82655 RepID=UPI002A5A0A39|nr:uncharacterized protein LOC133108041 [Conger conger]